MSDWKVFQEVSIPGARIIGLDISERMIEIGAHNVAEAGLSGRIVFRRGNAAEMPFGDAEFDFVISSGSLHHWSKPIKIFDEIYRVLRPEKLALVSDLRRDASKEKIQESSSHIRSRFMRWGLRHSVSESYTQQGIEELLSRTYFGKAERIDPDDPFELAMFIWLRRPASPLR